MANELLIKINADAKNAKKEFDNIREQTSDLESSLKTVALVSGAAFAALTAEIYLSAKAFEQARKDSVQLTTALQNQGIYTEELEQKYKKFADTVQAKTGIDNDAIIKAQAVAQTFLGQTEITEDLTFAIADLGASMGGDLNGAAEKIAKTIGSSTNALAKNGLQISDSATQAERYAKVLEFVQIRAGGLAEEFNKADGYTQALATSVGNFQETIGERFAPILQVARRVTIAFFDVFSNNPFLADLAAAAIAAGAAVTGLIAAAAVGVPAFLAFKAAMVAFGVASNIALAGIPLAIGAIVAGVTLLALNWDKTMAGLAATASGAVVLISELFSGLGKVLSGALSLDPSKIQQGLNEITEGFVKAKDRTIDTYKEITAAQMEEGEKQDANKKALADKEAAQERAHQARLRDIRKNETELLKLQVENASATAIDLKRQEIEILKALDQEKTQTERELLEVRREEVLALQDEQNAEDYQRAIEFATLMQESKAEMDALGIETEAQLREAKIAQLRATAMTEQDIDRTTAETILAKRIQARNQELLDRKKYGETIAKLNAFLNTDEVKGVKDASAELIQLQQSKNSTLRTIGKAAAITDITIKTAQSAINIFNGFSTIPIIGPALGVAGAAAAIAYGAEKIGTVTAAASGGLIEGGIPGRDSVPALLEPGELVVPRKNFNDVVGAVQNDSSNPTNGEMLEILKSIDAKFSNPQIIQITGDVMSDDSYVDAFVKKISDAVEFRNAQIFGVTS